MGKTLASLGIRKSIHKKPTAYLSFLKRRAEKFPTDKNKRHYLLRLESELGKIYALPESNEKIIEKQQKEKEKMKKLVEGLGF